MADTATQQRAQEASRQAQEKASELAGQARDQAQQAAGQARDQVRTQVDQRSTQAGEQIAGQAGDIRSISEQLREQGKDKPAQYVDQAADRAERLGEYLRDSDADRILHDVEDFARQRPWAVVAGGLALGFAASRLLKASSSERYRGRSGGPYETYGGSEAPDGLAQGVRPPVTPMAQPADGSDGVGSGIPAAPGTPAGADRRFDREPTSGGTVDPTGIDPTAPGPPVPPPRTAQGGL